VCALRLGHEDDEPAPRVDLLVTARIAMYAFL
jgi:hypothetical protein